MILKAVTIPPQRASYVYGKQQFFADRSAQINIPKSTQIGVEDKVSISPSAMVSAGEAIIAGSPAIVKNAISYDDPRKAIRAEKRQTLKAAVSQATGRGEYEGVGKETGYRSA